MFFFWTLALPLLLTTLHSRTSLADEPTFLRNKKYNDGGFGEYPTHKFQTSEIEPPRLNFMKPFRECDDGSYIFVAPRGNIAYSSFYILDHDGSMIWGPDHRYGEVYNFQVQEYKGEPYLTFWAGDDSVGGHGEGKYYMYDKHYQEYKVISAADGLRADLHSFAITPQGTVVFTGYEVMEAQLAGIGKEGRNWIWESMFQELDIEKNELIFEWRASDHVDFSGSFARAEPSTHNDPWDFFHINMVEKDEHGNYLVSSRYYRCAFYVDGKNGSVIWQLGGKSNSFKDLSDGRATTFVGQHDAHWADGHNAITMFDNRGDWFYQIEDKSRGQRIEIDLDKMTAKLNHSYVHPNHILSTSQGSYQTLENGHVLLGYGFNGAMTEFTAEGEVLCDAYFESASRFGSGDVQSYRNMKFNWTGIPLSSPSIAFKKDTIYVSWLGSTKVRAWLFQDSNEADGIFQSVQDTAKHGFETEFLLPEGKRMRQYVRAIALDAGGTQLAISPPVHLGDTTEIWGSEEEDSEDSLDLDDFEYEYEEDIEDVQILLILGVFALISALLVAWMAFGWRWMPWRRLPQNEKGEIAIPFEDKGRMRRIWHRVRMYYVPWSKKRWQEDVRHELLSDTDVEDNNGRASPESSSAVAERSPR